MIKPGDRLGPMSFGNTASLPPSGDDRERHLREADVANVDAIVRASQCQCELEPAAQA